MGPDVLQSILDEFEPPLVVKPSTQGSTIGLTIVQEEAELPSALGKSIFLRYGSSGGRIC